MVLSGRPRLRQNGGRPYSQTPAARGAAMLRPLAVSLLLTGACPAWGQEKPTVIPAPTLAGSQVSARSEKADLAGGCYWGTQGIFEHVKGIERVVAGFTGGRSDDDGGAESVMITFDPKVISYGQLLQIFFSVVHDPTQLNRQGPDVGSGYRSDIFYMSDQQRRIAQTYIAQLAHASVYPKPIVTRVDAFSRFNPVGIDQQDFMIKNPRLEYIEVNDLPKLTSLKQLFPASFAPLPREYH
jgi:peptide-methionine (S)-S-oxide reductase